MTTRTINYRFKLRGYTAAAWAALNPVLLDREPGVAEDTGRLKLGDGTTAWNDLEYLDELWPSAAVNAAAAVAADLATLEAELPGSYLGPAAAVAGASAAAVVGAAKVTGDTNDRFRLLADGKHEWRNPADGAVLSAIARVANGLEISRGFLTLKVDHLGAGVAPEMHFEGSRAAEVGSWGMGIDVVQAGGSADFVSVHRISPDGATVMDLQYWANRWPLTPTVGFGVTPPNGRARVQISGQDDEPAMGGLSIRVIDSTVGHPFAIHTGVPSDIFWINKVGTVSGSNLTWGSAIAIQADPINDRPLALVNNAGTLFYDFQWLGTGMLFRYGSGAVNIFQATPDGSTYWYETMRMLGKPQWFVAANEQTTVGAAGGASAPPATPTKYLKVLDSAGATLLIPAYAA